ncbi:MAG: hypothetical protein ACRD4C_00345 [Candidatus Acidiferrales bacterium]
MRRTIFIFAFMACVTGLGASHANAQTRSYSVLPPGADGAEMIDRIAARIDDDIITESEVRELSAFQKLVDGHAKARPELIQELADQWIVRGEASAAKYPEPSAKDVDRAYVQLEKQFPTPEEFKRRCASEGLSESAVRRMLGQQLYLARFLDFRFRPAAQVDQRQIETFYDTEFAPQLRKRGQTVPALADVADTIREVLIQRAINERATAWLDDTRKSLTIDVVPEAAAP